MREILFRGKRTSDGEWDGERDGEWIEGTLFRLASNLHPFIMLTDRYGESYEVDSETVGQFTGLTDKNGKKVFEGDIIKWDAKEWGAEYCEPVAWDYSFLGVRQNDWKEFCEAIGNIHDNPELLENP